MIPENEFVKYFSIFIKSCTSLNIYCSISRNCWGGVMYAFMLPMNNLFIDHCMINRVVWLDLLLTTVLFTSIQKYSDWLIDVSEWRMRCQWNVFIWYCPGDSPTCLSDGWNVCGIPCSILLYILFYHCSRWLIDVSVWRMEGLWNIFHMVLLWFTDVSLWRVTCTI